MAGGDVIWDPETGETLDAAPLIERFEEKYSQRNLSYERILSYREQVADSAWSPDGRHLALVSDHRLGIWDTETREWRASTLQFESNGLEWHPSGERILVGGELRDALTLDVLLDVGGTYSPAGDALAGSVSGDLIIWNPWKADVGAGWSPPVRATGDFFRAWLYHHGRWVFRVVGSALLIAIGGMLVLSHTRLAGKVRNLANSDRNHRTHRDWFILSALGFSLLGFGFDLLVRIPFDNLLVQALFVVGGMALLLDHPDTKQVLPEPPPIGRRRMTAWRDAILRGIENRARRSPLIASYLSNSSTRIGLACLVVGVAHWRLGTLMLI
jgi:hypothetical protein